MRIAYLTHYAELYGANRSLLDLILELRRRKEVEPHVLVPREGPITEQLAREGIPFAVIPWKPWMSERRYMGRVHHHIGQYMRYVGAANQRAKENRLLLPDILHQLEAWRIGIVHVNSAAVGVTALLEKALRIPLIWHIRELPERQYGLHIDIGRRRYGKALRNATCLIAISKAVYTDIQDYAGTATKARIIYNGVLSMADHARLITTANERWSAHGPFTFLLAGLIHPSKGQEEAIRAFALTHAKNPATRLVIAGDGKARHLEELIASLKLGHVVKLAGFVKNMDDLFRESHALLMCSRNEAMGRVTVEAMGNGLPVIGHASGGTLELVEDGITGSIYPGGEEVLSQQMLALADDPTHARMLGEKAQARAKERFSVERYADEVLEVYRSVLSRPRETQRRGGTEAPRG